MEAIAWIQRLENAYGLGMPFVCFAQPKTDLIHSYFQQNKSLYTTKTFSEEAFVMAPFEFEGLAYCIPKSVSSVLTVTLPKQIETTSNATIEETKADEHRHLELVAKAIRHIQSKAIEKVVLSRKKRVDLKAFELEVLITQLFNNTTEAFRYIWFHPETGLWCGATPEILLRTKGETFTTMSLAGTKLYVPNATNQWSPKEIEEQRLVTEDIRDTLEGISSILNFSKTKSHRAGNLVHLKTDITGVFKKGKHDVLSVLSLLHPTPAVCGVPTQLAFEFIKDNEAYTRDFYTGFVGPTAGEDSTASFYVNLRCMKIEGKQASLYVGGGITEASNAVAEWEETHNKLQTMLTVLGPML